MFLYNVKRHECRNLFYSVKCLTINGYSSFSTHFLVYISRQENGYFFKLRHQSGNLFKIAKQGT